MPSGTPGTPLTTSNVVTVRVLEAGAPCAGDSRGIRSAAKRNTPSIVANRFMAQFSLRLTDTVGLRYWMDVALLLRWQLDRERTEASGGCFGSKRKLTAAYHICASSGMIPAPDEIGLMSI